MEVQGRWAVEALGRWRGCAEAAWCSVVLCLRCNLRGAGQGLAGCTAATSDLTLPPRLPPPAHPLHLHMLLPHRHGPAAQRAAAGRPGVRAAGAGGARRRHHPPQLHRHRAALRPRGGAAQGPHAAAPRAQPAGGWGAVPLVAWRSAQAVSIARHCASVHVLWTSSYVLRTCVKLRKCVPSQHKLTHCAAHRRWR